MLTERQIRILQMLSEGMKHNEIEALVFRSRQTVELDMRVIKGTMKARNMTHAVAMALLTGVITGPKIG